MTRPLLRHFRHHGHVDLEPVDTMLPCALLAPLLLPALALAGAQTGFESESTSRLLTLAGEASSSGDHGKAIDLYGVVVEREPEDYLSRFKRSTAYMAVGQSKKAAEDLEGVLRISKDFDTVSRCFPLANETDLKCCFYRHVCNWQD